MTDNSAIAKYTINGTTTTLDADGSEAITSKSVTKTYSADTTVSVTVYDAAGNSKTVSKSFTNIDKINPVISSILGNPTAWTNNNVTLTVTATDEESGVAAYSFSNASGTYNWQTSSSKAFSKNQTVYIYVKDKAGNISNAKTVSITKIDKTVPTASVTSTATSASSKIIVTASDTSSGLHSTPYSFDGGATWQAKNTKIVTSTTTLTIKVRDKAGNIKTLSHTPSKTLPITVIPSTAEWTNENVRLTVTGTGIDEYKFDGGDYSSINYDDYSENTTASITIKDNNHQPKTITYTISNIDKVALSILSVDVTPETDYTNQPVTVSVSANDELSGVAEYSFDGGTTWQSENSVTFTDNTPKTVIVKVKDNAGNVKEWSESVKLPTVDNTAPNTPDIYEENGLVYIFSRSFDFDEATDSPEYVEYNINGGEWKIYDEPLEVVRTADTTVYARVRDEAGNVSEEAAVVLKNTLGEYTTSYTDIALGEGLFLVPFERTYTSTSGWFFAFEANITEYTNGYVFTDFYGEKQYFIKNGEDKYLSADGEELTVNAESYLLTYGDMTCTFNSGGKIIQIKTDYLDTTYTWSENTLVIDGGVTVTFTNGKVTKINITRTDNTGKVHTKETEYVWAEGNLTKFTDAAGNEHNYAYTNNLLTTDDTQNIEYSNGRVKCITQQNGAFVKYIYNEDGIRTSKTSNGVTTKFYLDGTNIIEQTDGATTLYFFYDSVGEIVGFKYNGNNYLYIKNSMGDIVGIADSAGNLISNYTYDAWGKVTSVTGSNTAIGELNPFRYRSYYYDSDIQMYYLQSRYYDPEIGRFINSDDVNYIGVTGTVGSYNPFAYCGNNSVNGSDSSGHKVVKSTARTYNVYVYYYDNVGKYGHVDISLDGTNIYSYGSYLNVSEDGKNLSETPTGAFKTYKYNSKYGGYFGKYKYNATIKLNEDEYTILMLYFALFKAISTDNKKVKIKGELSPYSQYPKKISPLYEYKVIRSAYRLYSITSASCATFVRDALVQSLPERAKKVSVLYRKNILPIYIYKLAVKMGEVK